MTDLGDWGTLSLTDRIRLYADGDKKHEIPARCFDFPKHDTDLMITALSYIKTLAKRELPHNFQAERWDLYEYCLRMSGMQNLAREISKRIDGETELPLTWEEGGDECICPVCDSRWNYYDNDTHRFIFCPHCGTKLGEEAKK